MESGKNFILTILLTSIISLLLLWTVSKVFVPKWIDHEDNRMSFIIKGFYKEEKNSLDVIFTGNSDVYRGVSPMALFEETGITSYNFVSAGQRMWIGYTMLEEVFAYQSPKVVFFNVDEVFYTSQTEGGMHKVYDNLAFGSAKIHGAFDSVSESDTFTRISYFLPIFAYHDRYKELKVEDFKYAFYDYSDVTKGMDLVAITKPYEEKEDYMKYSSEIAKIPEKNINYLNKMKVLCESHGAELILFETPSPDSWNYKKHNAVQEYANANHVKFLDLNLYLEEIGIDWERDTSDGGDHLNVFGAEKVSHFLGNYLKENYDFESHKGTKIYDKWLKQKEDYLKMKETEINLAA